MAWRNLLQMHGTKPDRRIVSLPMAAPRKMDLVKQVQHTFGIPVISCEYGMILHLFESGPQTASNLMDQTPVGSTTFFKKLGELLDAGLIGKARDTGDGRRSIYSLSDYTQTVLNEEMSSVRDRLWQLTHADMPGDYTIQDFIQRTIARLKIRFFSCEFHILLFLYEARMASAGDIFTHCRVSSTKFYAALENISEKRLVIGADDAADRRRRLYCLPDEVREQMDAVHGNLHAWITRKLENAEALKGSGMGDRPDAIAS